MFCSHNVLPAKHGVTAIIENPVVDTSSMYPVTRYEPAVSVDGCVFSPGSIPVGATLTVEHAHMVESTPTLYLPRGAVIKDGARVTVRGETYTVCGVPKTWYWPLSGTVSGIEAHLERIEG